MRQMKHSDAGSPKCDYCKAELREQPKDAKYDAPTAQRYWAYMCEEHYKVYGLGNPNLGTEFTYDTKE